MPGEGSEVQSVMSVSCRFWPRGMSIDGASRLTNGSDLDWTMVQAESTASAVSPGPEINDTSVFRCPVWSVGRGYTMPLFEPTQLVKLLLED